MYQEKTCSAHVLKLFAIAAMSFNHFAAVFAEQLPQGVYIMFNAIGGLCFPIMAFLLAEGWRHTHSVRRYALRLFLFAVLAQLPYQLVLAQQLNVLFTLWLGLLAITWTERFSAQRSVQLCIILAFVLLSALCDWGMVGILMILAYHYGGKYRLWAAYLFNVALNGGSALILMQEGSEAWLPLFLYTLGGGALALWLQLHYDGTQGKRWKYGFYLYYPLHIIVLGVMKLLV